MTIQHIAFSVAGEGLGHAARIAAIIDELDASVVPHVFTFGQAYEFFKNRGVNHLYPVFGLRFQRSGPVVDYTKTIIKGARYFTQGVNQNKKDIESVAKCFGIRKFVSDFEPSISRINIKNKTLISIDNQHRFSRCVVDHLPKTLIRYSQMVGTYTEWAIQNPNEVFITTFDHMYLPVKRQYSSNTQTIEPPIRKACYAAQRALKTKDSNEVLVYCREPILRQLLPFLIDIKKTFHIFSDKKLIDLPHFVYHSQDNVGYEFCSTMAKCRCVIATAGVQLISEAKMLGKPVLTIPEPKQYEQKINSIHTERSGWGKMVELENLNTTSISNFINDFKNYEPITSYSATYLANYLKEK